MPPPPVFHARLVAARPLAPAVRELTFERVDGAPMAFEAGQWVNAFMPIPPPPHLVAQIELPEEVEDEGPIETKRSYSIASAPDGSPRFELAVTRVQGGAASSFLHAAEVGTTLRFSGPQGFFTRPAGAAAPSLFVATGTGFTPLRSMLYAALAAGSRAPIWILLGVRTPADVLYDDELRTLADAHPFLRFEPTLSRPAPIWAGRTGYVQTHVRALWDELTQHAGAEPHAYICGLQRMVGSVRDLLRKEMAVARERVHSERYD